MLLVIEAGMVKPLSASNINTVVATCIVQLCLDCNFNRIMWKIIPIGNQRDMGRVGTTNHRADQAIVVQPLFPVSSLHVDQDT